MFVEIIPKHCTLKLLPWPERPLQPSYSWDWSAVRSSDIMRHRLQSAMRARDVQSPRVVSMYCCCCCWTEARYRTISQDRTEDQCHEFLGCKEFLARVVPLVIIRTPECSSWTAVFKAFSPKYALNPGGLSNRRFAKLNTILFLDLAEYF